MDKYTFPCGCQFDIIGPPKPGFKIPRLKIDVINVSFTCKETWNLISSGQTVGIFQVETDLGQTWCKKIKPESVHDMAAIGALLRPGCLKSVTDNKNMPAHYADRKNGLEDIKPYQELVDKCLEDTYGVLCYQEQSLRLVKEVAGFTLEEAEVLRKAIGKKLADEMYKMELLFKDKAKKIGILNNEQIDEVFGWIKNGERYSFCAGHAYAYGILGYISAYLKYHFPHEFYTAWLQDSIEQADGEEDVYKLVTEAQVNNIRVNVPNLKNLRSNFYYDGEQLHFGLLNVKGVGESVIKKIDEILKTVQKPLNILSWTEFLVLVAYNVNKNAILALIMSGALDYYKLPRNLMRYQFEKFILLNENEVEWIKENSVDIGLLDAIESLARVKNDGGGVNTKPRLKVVTDIIKMLENPSSATQDSPNSIIEAEKKYLGVGVTYTIADSINNDDINCSCADFKNGKPLQEYIFGVEISQVRPYNIKKGKSAGKKMYYLDVNDGTSNIGNCVIFPEQFEEYGSLLTPGNKVILYCSKDKKYGSLNIKKAKQA